jgi:hypothetical protein
VLLLVAGIALALPGLAIADTVAPATDPSADTTSADATATAGTAAGGAAADPAATTTPPAPTTPPAEPPAAPADPGTTTTGTNEPASSAPTPAPTPPPTPAETTPPPAPATATTDGAPVACTPADAAASAETACPALVLVETPDPAPAAAPAPEPQQQPAQQAPAQTHQPVLAPATETIVTPVSSGDAESTPVLAPLHGAPAEGRAPEPSLALELPKPAPPTLVEERSAPVLTVEQPAPAPVLVVAPDGRPELELVPSPTMVDRTPPAVLRQAALQPLLEHPVTAPTAVAAAGAEPDGSASGSDGVLASTGGDEPLPLFPPHDPSENPTGLGAPSSGGGVHGSTGVVAILTALLLLFVPRIVRRLRPPSSPAPLVGYRVVLERPG